ncbi:MAG TPA: hypothetical protein VN886_00195 [Acidimicrobiales bacterium]|nr:hypothetical protein [Acidimicrobiales bacterium]
MVAAAGCSDEVGLVGVGLAASSGGSTVDGATGAGVTGAGAPGAGADLATVRIPPAEPHEEPDEKSAAVTSAQAATQ